MTESVLEDALSYGLEQAAAKSQASAAKAKGSRGPSPEIEAIRRFIDQGGYQLNDPTDSGPIGGPLAAGDDVPYFLAKPDPNGATSQALNALGFLADKANLAMDAAKYYQVIDQFSPYTRFLFRATFGLGVLTDGYSMYSSVRNGRVPISGGIGLGTAAICLCLSGAPLFVVAGTGAVFSFAFEDPSWAEAKSWMFQLSQTVRSIQVSHFGGFGIHP